MTSIVTLDRNEEEFLFRIWEESLNVLHLRQFFLWAQGQFQALLPHEMMVCIKFAENGELEHIECIRGAIGDRRVIDAICDQHNGLAVRLARYYLAGNQLPGIVEVIAKDGEHPLSKFHAETVDFQLCNVIVNGTGPVSGGGTFFALFSLTETPSARHLFLLNLLLPALHLAFQRVLASDSINADSMPVEVLTERELEVLRWVAKGKTNYEIGAILDLSALTIKNHLQKIFKKLNVNNRMLAATRCRQLRLLDNESR